MKQRRTLTTSDDLAFMFIIYVNNIFKENIGNKEVEHIRKSYEHHISNKALVRKKDISDEVHKRSHQTIQVLMNLEEDNIRKTPWTIQGRCTCLQAIDNGSIFNVSDESLCRGSVYITLII